MELKPHFRVVRFTPVPEIQEPVNVALLFVDNKARLVSDYEFQKLSCIAPNFDKEMLKFWLEDIAGDLESIKPQDAFSHIASRSAQIQVGNTHWLPQKLSSTLESRLIATYLQKEHRHNKHAENHLQHVETLIDDAIRNPFWDMSGVLKRAEAKNFLSPAGVKLLATKNIHFARVLNGTKKIVLMDGLNLSVASKSQLRMRATTIGAGFYAIGNARKELEQVEQKEFVRAAFVLRRPQTDDPEIAYLANVLGRDSEFLVEPETGKNVAEIQRELQMSSANLLA